MVYLRPTERLSAEAASARQSARYPLPPPATHPPPSSYPPPLLITMFLWCFNVERVSMLQRQVVSDGKKADALLKM